MRITLFGLVALFALLPAPEASAQGGHDPKHHAARDSAFRALQQRGKGVMGVDQDRSIHLFTSRPEGGTIALSSDSTDTTATAAIRAHFREIAGAFATGDFTLPGVVHAGTVPGTAVMKARAARIAYSTRDIPGGAELVIGTRDRAALRAIHEFLAFQRAEHRAGPAQP
jgi:hypothetical protein